MFKGYCDNCSLRESRGNCLFLRKDYHPNTPSPVCFGMCDSLARFTTHLGCSMINRKTDMRVYLLIFFDPCELIHSAPSMLLLHEDWSPNMILLDWIPVASMYAIVCSVLECDTVACRSTVHHACQPCASSHPKWLTLSCDYLCQSLQSMLL